MEATAWDQHEFFLNICFGDFRLDAIAFSPTAGGDSVKASALNCSRIVLATQKESVLPDDKLPDESNLERLTRGYAREPSSETHMEAKARITNLEMFGMAMVAGCEAPTPQEANTFRRCPAVYLPHVPQVLFQKDLRRRDMQQMWQRRAHRPSFDLRELC